MPTMLGLTTDPSPHGLNANGGELTAQGKGKASGHGSLAVAVSKDEKKKKKKQTQDQQREALNNHDNPNKTEGRKLYGIAARNHAAARDMNSLFWRAMCDDPVSAMDYMADDVALVSPLLFGTTKAVTRKSEDPSLKETFESLSPFTGFRIQEMQTVEAALMAVASMCRLTLGIQGDDGEERIEVMVHSTWRQDAGADWYLVGQLIAETG